MAKSICRFASVLRCQTGTASGRPVKAVQVGGPLGAYFPPALFDTPFGYEEFAGQEGLVGHAGIVVFDDTQGWLPEAPETRTGPVREGLEFVGLLPDSSQQALVKRVIGVGGDGRSRRRIRRAPDAGGECIRHGRGRER